MIVAGGRYGLADEEDLSEMSEQYRRERRRLLTEDEIRSELEEKLNKLPPPVTVVLRNQVAVVAPPMVDMISLVCRDVLTVVRLETQD